ncbi:MAG: response regulator [Treponema sp.]|nr:response regulator [Treponema sp.]
MEGSELVQTAENDIERLKIIYVDDVQCSLVSVKKRLKGYYEVYPAESTLMLFKILEKIRPHLILLDVNMPGIDGYKTIKSIKADERFKDIPVVFLTSNSDKESVIKGLSLGAVDYIIKPFITAKLIECIEKHTFSNRHQKPVQAMESESKPSVLVVDDVPSTLKAIELAINTNYEVYTLSKPECVIDFLKERKPDLILLDYLMPVLNGFDLILMIKAISDFKNIPIIMLTSEGTLPQLNEAISLGAADFIVKPFKTIELNEKIDKHIKLSMANKIS